MNGDATCLTQEVIANINSMVVSLLYKTDWSPVEVEFVGDVLHISNIIYNNTDRSILVLEDGVYDLLIEVYKKYNPNYQVGAEPIQINMQAGASVDGTPVVYSSNGSKEVPPLFASIPFKDTSDMLFGQALTKQDEFGLPTFADVKNANISKRIRNTSHKYPQLVGTLDKAKFVLDTDAIGAGVYDKPSTCIFERDFLRKHVQAGIVDPNNITLVLELKYDGVSVEAEVTDRVLSARTRGDTQMDKASDITPILKGYQFNRAMGYDITPFGMKFEAVISYKNLRELNMEFGKSYANARTAIIGITGNSKAAAMAKYITLVPLATSHDNMNRVEELEFMNKYYSTGEFCRYTVVSGNYETVLYQVCKFVQEAEMMRDYLPYMYDGVVVSYLDPRIRNILGRKNSVNQYSIAIKFQTKKKLTRCRAVSFSIGSTGELVPMVHYDPVEFIGAIQTKSSLHSYARFMKLGLKPSDVIELEFTNDVMVYVTKANVEENLYNPRLPFQFPTHCPVCGTQLEISDSYASVRCPNYNCNARIVARLTNMIAKLGFKGFSEASVRTLDTGYSFKSFYDLMNMTKDQALMLGPTNADTLMSMIDKLHEDPIPDYIIVGSLGFTNIAAGKWKTILKNVPLDRIAKASDIELLTDMSKIRGVGDETANTIVRERRFFMKDIAYILTMNNIIYSHRLNDEIGVVLSKTIRFTGVRDEELMRQLIYMGHDCSEGSVTKSTDILLIPYVGFSSGKVEKAERYNQTGSRIKILTLEEFRLNMSTYLREI